MATRTIYTLEARNNVWLESITNRFKLDTSAIYNSINTSFDELLSILQSKNIEYEKLKNALIPQINRMEAAFVFDSSRVNSSAYGYTIFDYLIPLLDKDSTNSILAGDYIGEKSVSETLKKIFLDELIEVRKIEYVHHSLFYIIYLNNLSNNHFEKINVALKKFDPYVGYFDLTYSSFAKTILSMILVRLGIKHKNTFIMGTEEGEDLNNLGLPFEVYGYVCKGIETMYADLFLSYKIEREVLTGFESDTAFSINAVSTSVFDLEGFRLIIEESKMKYLVGEKNGSMKRAGFINLTIEQLETLVKNKITQNYIYNLSYLPKFQIIKFNILVETSGNWPKGRVKLLVTLEYVPARKLLRLITMY